MDTRNPLGRVRLHCDDGDCDRKFVPRRKLVDVGETRKVAELYGWAWQVRDGETVDYCPVHRDELKARGELQEPDPRPDGCICTILGRGERVQNDECPQHPGQRQRALRAAS